MYMARLTANENVVQPSTEAKYELKDWKSTSQVRSGEFRNARLLVTLWNPCSRSAGQTSRRISRFTIRLSIANSMISNRGRYHHLGVSRGRNRCARVSDNSW